MKILIVEDDHAVAQALQLLLSSYSYAVDIAADGEAALQMADAFEYHLVLLDVLLPRLSGVEVCRQLRKKGFRQPILLLTGQRATQQKAIALNAGADDYVVKPFDNDELVARIQALLRRGATAGEPVLTWGQLSLDPNTCRVAYREQLLALTPKEFAILELFLRHQEKVLSARAILDQAWSSVESPGEEVVRCHIKDLRQKLAAVGAPKDLIKTVHRVGYRLNPLYAASAPQMNQSSNAAQVAELRSVNEELRVAMEQLRSTQDELQQRNQELQAIRDDLEQRVSERTRDRKQAEAALQSSEEQRRLALDLTSTATWDWDLATGRVRWSENMFSLFGLVTGAVEPTYDLWQRCVHPDDIQHIPPLVQTHLQHHTLYQAEYRVVHPDGSIHWVLSKGHGVYDALGQAVRMIGITMDISDRKQAEGRLRESEQKYRSLFESINQGFCLLEVLFDANDKAIDYRFVEINEAFEQQSGLANAVGKTILELVPNLEPQWAELYGQVAKSGESVRFEADVPSMSRIFDIYAFPSGTPGQHLVAVLFTDITERKRAEAAVAEDLQDTQRLHALSTRLTTEMDIQVLYDEILATAIALTHADAGTVQILDSATQNLLLLATQGFDKTMTDHFYRVNASSNTPCGLALATGDRTFVDFDVPESEDPDGSLRMHLNAGYLSAQSTPLVTRSGTAIGMVSTHWCKQYRPSDRQLRFLDLLSRQAADLIEHRQFTVTLQENEQLLRLAMVGAQAGSWDWVVTTGQITWSPETYQLYGLDPTASPPAYNDWYENILHPDDRSWVSDYMDQVITQCQSDIQLEFRILHPQQGIRWILSLGHLMLNEQGEPVRLSGINLDISDRKQAELILQQSEARFRHFAENSHAVIWIAEPTSLGCTYVSPAYEVIWGRSCQSLLDAPQSWIDAIHPADRDQVVETLRQKRQQNTSSVEYRIIRPDGTIRWIEDRGFTVRDEKGQIYSYAGISEDISERKQAELNLQQQVRQEYLLADIAQEIRQSLDLDQILHSTVDRIREWLECDRVVIFRFRPDWQGEVIMESVGAEWTPILSTTIFDPCFHDHYIEPYRQGRVATLSDIDTADLEPCYIKLLQQFQVKANVVVPILQNNHLWGLLIVHHCAAARQWQPSEITALKRLATQVGIAIQQSELYQQIQLELRDRQQAEQKIREQAALLDISTDAILVCDLDCRILYWNRGAEYLYGWQAEEVLGQKANELLSRSPSTFVSPKRTVLEQGTWHGEIQKVTKTGREVTVEGRCTLVRDEMGQPKSILVVDTDITEKKNLEAQFHQAQRLESLGTLAGGIAHDLNNALTPILSIAQLLRMQNTKLDARSQEMLQILEDSAQRGAQMVQQILTFTRGKGGEKSPVDVASLFQEAVSVIQQTFPKSITIHTHIPASGVQQVSADATQLHQVLINLCVNARDAMPDGGTLTLSVENFEVNEIFAQMNLDAHVGQYVLITVADTGTGIAPEVRDRIFDPFFTTKAIGQGTGLGLSTVLGIIRSYSGFIQVTSEVGEGTQFKIYLPAVEMEVASNFQETTLPQGQGELILVVDDEDRILRSTCAILEAHQYQVLTARSGAEAIATYAQHQQKIAVVLVDMMMPDMDGIMLIRVLQEMNSQVRAIAVSGLLPQYRNSLEALGIKTHLNKPYTTEEVLNSIHLQLR